MNRPFDKLEHHATTKHGIYHRGSDEQREKALAGIIQEQLGLDDMLSLGNKSHIDYIGVRGGAPVAGIELISRNYTFEKLQSWGGIYIKEHTLETARRFSDAKLSTIWKGCFFFYDLKDGLYWQEANAIQGKQVRMNDPRKGNSNDTDEAGIAITNLVLWLPWT